MRFCFAWSPSSSSPKRSSVSFHVSTEQLLGNIRIFDAVDRSAAADRRPVAL